MKKPFNYNAAIRGAIRRVFARSPAVIQVREAGKRKIPWYNKDGSRAKVDRNEFHCQVCDKWVMGKIDVDHIDPVISVEDGFVDWNTFVDRIGFEKPENLQRICSDCHDKKTAKERFERMFKEELRDLGLMESPTADKAKVKAGLKKYTPKRLEKFPYPTEFKERVLKLKALVKK